MGQTIVFLSSVFFAPGTGDFAGNPGLAGRNISKQILVRFSVRKCLSVVSK
ncbi:hypothetical protein SBA3_1490023 [Candidatus Sulfopaludibacter sp. SbA3]|nr:hypothetical protein SBA3_1490023 [Candidatus Sulfopaludibacter sp. SbA3]